MTIELTETFTVEPKHAASALGSGLLDVLATPSMIAFMEGVAQHAVEGELAEGQGTVGTEVNIKHLAATAIGKEITVHARVRELIKERFYLFDVSAYEGDKLIGEGTHTRAIINNEQFMANLNR